MINMQAGAFKTDDFCVVFELYKTDGAFVLLLIVKLELFYVVLHDPLGEVADI